MLSQFNVPHIFSGKYRNLLEINLFAFRDRR